MKYPNLTLEIDNHLPKIYYSQSEDNKKLLIESSDSLSDVLLFLAQELDLTPYISSSKIDDQIVEILEIARNADESIFLTDNTFTFDKQELNILDDIKNILGSLKEQKEDYSKHDLTSEVLAELNKNQNSDILASILDSIYVLLAGRVIIYASELGIGNIYLNDLNNNARLREKIGRELQELNINLESID